MLIRCPECGVCYRIEESLLADRSRKLRCAKCAKVWEAKLEDCFEEEEGKEEEVYDLTGKQENPEKPNNQQEENKQDADSLFKIREAGGQLDAESDSLPAEDAEAEAAPETKPATDVTEDNSEGKEDKIDEKDLALGSDMQQIFSRLNKQTEIIAEIDKNTSPLKKAMTFIRENFWRRAGLRNTTILTILGLIILSSLSFRYELSVCLKVVLEETI